MVEDTELKVRISSDPRGLNFLLNLDANSTMVMRLLSPSLLDFNPNTYELEPVLAKSLPSTKEMKEGSYKGLLAHKYEILEQAVWDDGTPITGNDFLFTLKAIYNPNYSSPYAGSFDFVENVEINLNNPKEFTVYARKYFIGDATIGTVAPMPSHILDPNNIYDTYTLTDLRDPNNKEKMADDPQLKEASMLFTSPKTMGHEGELSGLGAYKLTSWEQGKFLVLVKKDNWWGNQIDRESLVANPKKIIFKIVPDFNAARSLFLNGELDIMKNIGVDDFKALKKNTFFKENYNFYTPPMFAHRSIIINTTDVRLMDKKVRRALAHLLDLEEVFDVVYGGKKNIVTSVIHPSKSTYNRNLKPIEYNVEIAKSLLKEAGWSDSNNNGILDKVIDEELQELNLRILFAANFNNFRNIAQIFQEGVKKAGVNLNLTPVEARSLGTMYKQKDYELGFLGFQWYPIHKDLKQRWYSNTPYNYPGFGTVESDKIIDEISQTTDEDKLTDLYMRFQEIFYDEQPLIFINTATNHIISNKKFGDITTSAVPPNFFLHQVKQVAVPVTFSKN